MRIITQEELDQAVVKPWRVLVAEDGIATRCGDCAAYLNSIGHTEDCQQTRGADWGWHGVAGEAPTPENIYWFTDERMVMFGRCASGHPWGDQPSADAYMTAVHARAVTLARAITGDFDEDAERARLTAVPA